MSKNRHTKKVLLRKAKSLFSFDMEICSIHKVFSVSGHSCGILTRGIIYFRGGGKKNCPLFLKLNVIILDTSTTLISRFSSQFAHFDYVEPCLF